MWTWVRYRVLGSPKHCIEPGRCAGRDRSGQARARLDESVNPSSDPGRREAQELERLQRDLQGSSRRLFAEQAKSDSPIGYRLV